MSTLGGAARLVAHPGDADVHRADEAHPVLVLGEATGQVRAAGDHDDHEQRRHRDEGDHDRDPRVRDVEERRLDRDAEQREERERDETGEPLDRDRRERDVAAGGSSRPG